MTRTFPNAQRLPIEDDFHGTIVPDPYRWLEQADSSDAQRWSESQRTLFEQERDEWVHRERFAESLTELLQSGSVSPPYRRGDVTFFTRREPGQQFPVLYCRVGDEQDRVLIDPMALDPTGLTTLDSWQPSKEGLRLAYQLSVGGTEESELYVMDVTTGETIEGPIDRCRYSPVAWLPGAEAFYYVRRLPPEVLPTSEQNFHRRVYLHSVGTSTEDDVLVFGSGMTMTNYYGVEVSRDGRWLQVSAAEGTEPRNDLWIADLMLTPADQPRFELVQGDIDAQTGITVGRDGRLYVSTDLEAPRGRIALASPGAWRPDDWTPFIPEDPDAVLDGFAVLDGAELVEPVIAVVRTRHGVSELTIHAHDDGRQLRTVPLPGAGTLAGPVEQPAGGPEAWFVYTDHTTVPTIYRYDARTDEFSEFDRPPGVVDVPTVFSRQVEYSSKDGTTVRMFIMSPTIEPDQPRPTVLYGYGGFGIPLTPGYSASILSWVAAGGVWAIANLRGGGEEGEEWHRAGMLGNKQNVFDDFHAAAEFLIETGWTTPQQLGISGGSNGGLLVGAALTQRPELFNAVVCAAPLLDMIRYVTSELGPTWTVEYGDPADPEQFQWLYSYSPYHRVRDGVDYPATMIAVFDNDTRTDPMHGRKMCAALQHATVGDRPILLRNESDVGHGARSLARSIEESADTLGFLAHWTGLRWNT